MWPLRKRHSYYEVINWRNSASCARQSQTLTSSSVGHLRVGRIANHLPSRANFVATSHVEPKHVTSHHQRIVLEPHYMFMNWPCFYTSRTCHLRSFHNRLKRCCKRLGFGVMIGNLSMFKVVPGSIISIIETSVFFCWLLWLNKIPGQTEVVARLVRSLEPARQ